MCRSQLCIVFVIVNMFLVVIFVTAVVVVAVAVVALVVLADRVVVSWCFSFSLVTVVVVMSQYPVLHRSPPQGRLVG